MPLRGLILSEIDYYQMLAATLRTITKIVAIKYTISEMTRELK